jgi:hypothetical protein
MAKEDEGIYSIVKYSLRESRIVSVLNNHGPQTRDGASYPMTIIMDPP